VVFRAVNMTPQTSVAMAAQGASPRWMYVDLLVQMACQIVLLIPGVGAIRPLARSAAFGISLAILIAVTKPALTRHPVRAALWVVLLILFLSAANPDSGGPLAAFASFCMHLAIIGPVFWVARLRCGEKELTRVLVLMWLLSTASATVGVLQVWFPGRFQPVISEFAHNNLGALMIDTASGARIPRPTGLTDTPGGAASSALYAALLGLGVALMKPFRFAGIAAAVTSLIGITCLYLCQIRSLVVMLVICVLGMVALFGAAGRVSRFTFTVVAATAVFIAGMSAAVALGGPTTLDRLEALISVDPTTVYQASRGVSLQSAFERSLPQYPLGAGLGRWGQVSTYFSNAPGRALYAETQWLGWIYDGGIPLLIAYPTAVVMVLWNATRLALRRVTPGLEGWATVIAGYNLGALALTFSYPIFMSSIGIEFWLVNAALIQAEATFAASIRAGLAHASVNPSRATSDSSTIRAMI
jgi:hypothetical protein